MSTLCTYHTAGQRCPDVATHVALSPPLAPHWQVYEVQLTMGEKRHPEFCAAHAMQVAEARNTAQMVAQEARLERPRTKPVQHCAVCGERLQGVGIQIPEVPAGPVCDACHRAANDAQLDDPRTRPPTRRRRRKAAC